MDMPIIDYLLPRSHPLLQNQCNPTSKLWWESSRQGLLQQGQTGRVEAMRVVQTGTFSPRVKQAIQNDHLSFCAMSSLKRDLIKTRLKLIDAFKVHPCRGPSSPEDRVN